MPDLSTIASILVGRSPTDDGSCASSTGFAAPIDPPSALLRPNSMGTDRDESSNIPLNRRTRLITHQGQEEPRQPQILERVSECVVVERVEEKTRSRQSCQGSKVRGSWESSDWGQIDIMFHGSRSKHYHWPSSHRKFGFTLAYHRVGQFASNGWYAGPYLPSHEPHLLLSVVPNTPRVITSTASSIGRCSLSSEPRCIMCTIRKCQHLTPLLQWYYLHLVSKTFNGRRQLRLIQGACSGTRLPAATNNADIVGVTN
jgi:hypothetical protein